MFLTFLKLSNLNFLDVRLSRRNILQIPPAEEAEMDGDAFASYIESIGAAGSASSDVSEDDVKAMFAADGEALELDGPEPAEDDSEDAALLASAEPIIPSAKGLDFEEVSYNFEGKRLVSTVF